MNDEPQITVSKMTGYVHASKELMDDSALDLNAFFNPTRRQRLHRRLHAFRSRLALRAFRLIAGHDLAQAEPYDWDDE